MKNSELRTIFSNAWTIFRNGFASTFADALKKAWALFKITLGRGVGIEYRKETGELRTAFALQLGSIKESLSKGFVRYMEEINGSMQWRSFRIENLLTN